ncbi:MAG: response regulator transcription factor [Clostridia bacterium]|nr:response regulator transcription factor [Clostridia bacterium]
MRLLFAEDDPDLRKAVTTLLERSGYSVDAVANGEDALAYAMGGGYDGIVLDWMMPKKDGIAVLCSLREGGDATPCMLLTAREAVEDRVKGLDAGADDYLAKPFSAPELLARIRAMLRRGNSWQPDLLTFGDAELDRDGMLLKCGGNSVRLNTKAFRTMELLMSRPGMVFSAERIMERVWGWDSDAEINVVWVNISFLRKKLAEIGSRVTITAVRGSGYVMEEKI